MKPRRWPTFFALLFLRSRPKAAGLSSFEINKTVARHVLTLPFCSFSSSRHELQHASRSIRRRATFSSIAARHRPEKIAGIFRRHRASVRIRERTGAAGKSARNIGDSRSRGIRGTCSPTRVDRANSIVLPCTERIVCLRGCHR